MAQQPDLLQLYWGGEREGGGTKNTKFWQIFCLAGSEKERKGRVPAGRLRNVVNVQH